MICVKNDLLATFSGLLRSKRNVDNSDMDKIMALLDVSCESQGLFNRTSCSFCIHLEVNHPQGQLENSPSIFPNSRNVFLNKYLLRERINAAMSANYANSLF
ncbi:hypothetical protein OESDEN_24179 [Oesophagostomum dentatum]|uniref:Uncharacterized protein n=1 Tax=Oesophagostomum dentatum TaxID=61180 RepID=A0A0B1RX51_OESDE|nr:hypothetical protein OESDEN_24179 [Oesophagostomum dentatum]